MAFLLGQAARGTTADFGAVGARDAFKLVAIGSGDVRHVYIHPKVANATLSVLTCAIYADSAGSPGARLTAETSPAHGAITSSIPGGTTAAGMVRYDLATPLTVVNGTTYHVGFRHATEAFDFQGDAVANVYREVTPSGGSLPDPWGGPGSLGGNTPAIFATDAPVPQVVAENALADAAAGTTHAVPYPAPSGGILAGDLLLCFVGEDAAAGAAVSWPAGWTELLDTTDATTAVNGACAWRKAAGGETGTFTVTTAGSEGGGIRVLCIRGAADPTVTPPELTSATGSSTNPDPPSETASWGAEDGTLWIAAAANDANVAITAGPANYLDFANTRWANTNGAGVATAWRYLTAGAAAENPGVFTMATEQWVAWTVAVRQSAPAGGGAQTVTLTGIGSAEAFGAARLDLVVAPAGIASAEAFGSSSVQPGSVSVTLTGIGSAEAFGATSIQPPPQTVTLAGVATAEAWGAATVTPGPAQVSPAGIASAEAWGASTLARGPVSVTLTGIGSAEAFGAATVARGPVSVTATGIASAEAFGSSSVQPGPVTVTLAGVASAEAFGAATVARGAVTVAPAGIPSAEAFGNTTVIGPVTVTLAGIGSAEAWGATTVIAAGAVAFAGVPSSEAWGAATVTRGAVSTTLAGVPSSEAWGAATVTRGPATVTLAGVASGETWGAPAVQSVQAASLAGIDSLEAWGIPVLTIIISGKPGHIEQHPEGHSAVGFAGHIDLTGPGHIV